MNILYRNFIWNIINSNISFQRGGNRFSFLLLAFVFRYPHGHSVFSGLSDALGVCGHLSTIGHSQNGVTVIFSQFYSRLWHPFPPPFGKLSVNPLLSGYENQLLPEQGGSWLFEFQEKETFPFADSLHCQKKMSLFILAPFENIGMSF